MPDLTHLFVDPDKPTVDPRGRDLSHLFGGSAIDSITPPATDTSAALLPLSLRGAIPKENVRANSDEVQEVLNRGLHGGVESLTDAERKLVKMAREQFPKVDAAFKEAELRQVAVEERREAGSQDPETALLERISQNLTGPQAAGNIGGRLGVVKSIIDVVAVTGKGISDAVREESARSPAPVSPFRDTATNPLSDDEIRAQREFDQLSIGEKAQALGTKVGLGAISGSVDFVTQTLDPIINPEKYGTTTAAAIEETAVGLVDMFAEAPDQAAHLLELMNAPDGLVRLAETAGTILQAGRLLSGEDRQELKEEAVNHLYENPESLLFAVLMAKSGVKGITKAKQKLGPESEVMLIKRSELEKVGEEIVKEKADAAQEGKAVSEGAEGAQKVTEEIGPAPEGLVAPRPSSPKVENEGNLQRNQRVQSNVAHHVEAIEVNREFIAKNPNLPAEEVAKLNEYQNRIEQELGIFRTEMEGIKRKAGTPQDVYEAGQKVNDLGEKPAPEKVKEVKELVEDKAEEAFVSAIDDVVRPKEVADGFTPEGEPTPLKKIGDAQSVAGIDAIVADVRRIDGVDYELYNANKLKDKRGVLRVIDAESGEVVTIQTFPTFDAAEAAFKKALPSETAQLELQAEVRGGGLGIVTEETGPQPFKAIKEKLGDITPTIGTIGKGVTNWFKIHLGTRLERFVGGFDEVGLGGKLGKETFHTLREAEVAQQVLAKLEHKMSIKRAGDLLIKELENFKPTGRSEKDIAFLKKELSYQINKAIKAGDKETLLALLQKVDSKAFQVAKGIKDVTPEGDPIFGTMQRAGVYKAGDQVPDGLIPGERIKGRGIQHYREITPEVAEAAFNELSRDGQEFARDYAKRAVELKEESGITSENEGYVKSFEKQSGITQFRNLWSQLKKQRAGARKYRTGILAEQGREIQSLILAEEKVRIELGAENIHNEAAGKLMGLAAKKLGSNEPIPDGWTLLDLGDNQRRAKQVLKWAEPLLKERKIDISDLLKQSDILNGKRIVVPTVIAGDLGGIMKGKGTVTVNPAVKAMLELGDEAAGWVINNAMATMLIRPKTTALNFISGEMQYGTRMMENFYLGLITRDMTAFKNDMRAYYGSLSPHARRRIPGELLGEQFIDQFMGRRGQVPGYKQLLSGMKATELLQKRRVMDSSIRTQAKNVAGGDKRIEAELIENPTREMLQEAYEQMDRTQYDYANLPQWMLNMKRSKLGRLAVAFPSYMYKGTRHMASTFNVAKDVKGLLSSELSPAEKAQRAAHFATAATWATAGYLVLDKLGTKEEDWTMDTEARIPISYITEVDPDNPSKEYRIWADIRQLPFVREVALGKKLMEGDYDYVATYTDAIFGLGPGIQMFDLIRGVRDEFQKGKPAGAIAGRQAATTFTPYGPVLQYMRRKKDPIKRKGYDNNAGFAKNFYMGFAAEMPDLSESLDTAQVDPLTLNPIVYKDLEVDVSFWTPFNVRLRNNQDYQMFLFGQLTGIWDRLGRGVSRKGKLFTDQEVKRLNDRADETMQQLDELEQEMKDKK